MFCPCLSIFSDAVLVRFLLAVMFSLPLLWLVVFSTLFCAAAVLYRCEGVLVQIIMAISLYSLMFPEHTYLQFCNSNHNLRSCNTLYSSRSHNKETGKVNNAEILHHILNNNINLLNEQWNWLFCCVRCKFRVYSVLRFLLSISVSGPH